MYIGFSHWKWWFSVAIWNYAGGTKLMKHWFGPWFHHASCCFRVCSTLPLSLHFLEQNTKSMAHGFLLFENALDIMTTDRRKQSHCIETMSHSLCHFLSCQLSDQSIRSSRVASRNSPQLKRLDPAGGPVCSSAEWQSAAAVCARGHKTPKFEML